MLQASVYDGLREGGREGSLYEGRTLGVVRYVSFKAGRNCDATLEY